MYRQLVVAIMRNLFQDLPRWVAILSLTMLPAVAGNAQEATFINVEGKKVHYVMTEGKSPTVVFVSGLGEAHETWEPVQKALHGLMTISYDRPGLGLSAPAVGRRDAKTLARELHDMLAALKVKPPYLLVGHSLGGAVVQIYANWYPQETRALVLVDPEDGRLIKKVKEHLSKDEWDRRAAAVAQYAPLNAQQQREMDKAEASGNEVAEIHRLPNVPIVLFTGTQMNPEFPGNIIEQNLKIEMHRQLMADNPQMEQVLVPESRHYVHDEKPEVVIAAIKKFASQ